MNVRVIVCGVYVHVCVRVCVHRIDTDTAQLAWRGFLNRNMSVVVDHFMGQVKHTRAHTHTHIHAQTHTRTYTRKHTHTYTHINEHT